ncbi:hypothetical protein ACRAKI_09675 [Saccharothrix isguenensis]
MKDLDTTEWTWTVRRQTTNGPGGLIDKGTKGKRARRVPIIKEIRELVERRIAETDGTGDARLFTGPRVAGSSHASPVTPRTGTRWSTSSATNTYAATTCGTPA